ncbi:MAG: GNAT family N-acetyltransferase [Acidobacteriaceae bacterium]
MLRTAIIENPHDLQRIRPLWEEFPRCGGMTMFQGYAWNAIAMHVFREREMPRFVYVESDAGVALVPCVIGKDCGVIHLAGERMFDYRDVLLAGDESLLARAWATISDWDLEFESKALYGEEAGEKWSALPVRFFANAPRVNHSAIAAEEFLKAHNRMGRFSRRFQRQGITLHKHSGSNQALIRTIYDRKASQEVPTNLFRDPLRREFMAAIAAQPEAHCEVFTYESAGELVAALVTFRDGDVRRFYTTYFDRRWASQSPGQVLLYEITAQSLRDNLDCDYMTGEYPYKNRFATGVVSLYGVKATSAQLRVAAAQALKRQPDPLHEPLVA